ncbi:MAG: alpha/beta fold hydrolase [Polyangiales bacterium]
MPDQTYQLSSAVDGMMLQAYAWRAPRAPRAVVVIAHGAAEHALRYERFARALNLGGYEARALDHRGHGRSLGAGGLGDMGEGGWDALVADLGQLIDHTRAVHAGVPVVLFGHSMGSFAAQQYCPDGSAAIAALVLSGSTAWEPPQAGAAPAPFAPNAPFEPARTPYDWLSRDPVEVDAYIADPLCGFETQRGRRPGPRFDAGRLGDPAALRRIRSDLPVLLVSGDEDPINRKLEGLRLLERRWRAAGVRRIDTRYYAGGRHEMLNETNRDEVTRDVVAWLQDVTAT